MANKTFPAAEPASVPQPQDMLFPGTILLDVDVTDVDRRIFCARQTIPVPRSGPMTLFYPKWLPGYHSPQAPIELFAGLQISADGEALPWKRHPVEVNAFHIVVPEGAAAIEAEFQYLSPTSSSQGDLAVTPDLLIMHWNTVLLYPAGYYSRGIMVRPRLTIPKDWHLACAIDAAGVEDSTTTFPPTRLDVLVDSPVFAGRHFRRFPLDDAGLVRLNIFADAPDLLHASEEQIDLHWNVVTQADLLFGKRPFDRFEILMVTSADVTNNGIEHHRSCEVITVPDYFTEWDKNFVKRDTIPHEFAHAWNGKYRRGADSWTPTFERPIRNSLLWVYEGQTQYWTNVLCARSGLWTADQALGALAMTAATHELNAGSRWRPMSDTTRDPIIAGRCSLPWPSWQRSEDYYSEGALVWLDVDTRIRQMTDDRASLDDFARGFFAARDGSDETLTYEFADIVEALDALAPFEWSRFFLDKLEGTGEGAPLAGLERGGYRLVYRDHPTSYWQGQENMTGMLNLVFSLGIKVSSKGAVNEVIWESPAFEAGLTAGSTVKSVRGQPFTTEALKAAIVAAASEGAIELEVGNGSRSRTVTIKYDRGLRYPHLEAIPGARLLLDDILAPRRAPKKYLAFNEERMVAADS